MNRLEISHRRMVYVDDSLILRLFGGLTSWRLGLGYPKFFVQDSAIWYCCPETQGLSFEEINGLFGDEVVVQMTHASEAVLEQTMTNESEGAVRQRLWEGRRSFLAMERNLRFECHRG